MATERLRDYLDRERVSYQTIRHAETITAQETAQSAHIRGREFAKTVMVKLDGRLAMAVLPADRKLNLGLLQKASGAQHAELADEDEFKSRFPECDVGAMPPFGNLYDMEVFAAERLAEDESIAFNAGSHTELVKMSYRDFERLVKPVPARLY